MLEEKRWKEKGMKKKDSLTEGELNLEKDFWREERNKKKKGNGVDKKERKKERKKNSCPEFF